MNVLKVNDDIFRGSQPKTVDDLASLKNMGVKYCLNLQTGEALLSDGSPMEESWIEQNFSIKMIAFPLGLIAPPSHDKLNEALSIIQKNQPIYIHCKDGVDRTGMVCAWYRMRKQGWSKHAATQEMKELGMHWWLIWWGLTL
jgi:tyrosine-protein phosphatase SIW14